MDGQSVASAEWEDLALSSMEPALADFFRSNGLGKFAGKIAEATDVESLEDLKLIDSAMVEDLIKQTDLKLVSAKKLRMALAKLRGEDAPDSLGATPPSPSHASPASPSNAAQAAPPPPPPAASSPSSAAPEPAPEDGLGAASADAQPAPSYVQECIAICIDRSGSMGSPFNEVTVNVVEKARAQRTRMEAVKAMFYAFRDRTESMGTGNHHMGLVQFDDKIERLLNLTPRLDRFEAIVDDMEKRGQTAIYSAIMEAVSMLEAPAQADVRTDLRVLVLTDGQNNTGVPPQEALAAVNRIGAVVDAIIVGEKPDADLRRIVSVTGGECYQIRDLGEGFELLEAESVVSLRARRGDTERPPPQPREPVDFASVQEKTMTQAGKVKRAPVLDPALASQAVTSLQKLPDTVGRSGGPVVKRMLKELKDLSASAPPDGVHIFPAPDNILFWRVLVEGPVGSPFEGGVFALAVVMPDDYPFKPPKINFETPVYHCNINDSGAVCLDILKDSWSPALTVVKALLSIRSLLEDPNPNDALRQWIAELTIAHANSGGTDTRYVDNAREATARDASTTVEEWKQRWGCS